MKYLSFRTFLICILMPPALYLFTLQGMEILYQKNIVTDLQGIMISDAKPLMDGEINIQDEISKNITAYLSGKYLVKIGVSVDIIVKTKTGRLIYPRLSYNKNKGDLPRSPSDLVPPNISPERLKQAQRNWQILREGLQIIASAKVHRNSWLANGILTFYIMLFVFLPYRAYLVKSREAQKIEKSKKEAVDAANQKLMDAQQRLMQVSTKEKQQQQEIQKLKADLHLADDKARQTEDEALAEIERLDNNLNESIKLRQTLESEAHRLEQELKNIEASHQVPSTKQRKQINDTLKRFKALYKNLEFHPRAVQSFLDLEANMQLQVEELIHMLNEDGSKIPVKRKVFIKKGGLPIFECEFGKKGRFYWGPGSGTKRQVLAVGTKNSQHRDLAFLQGLS